MSSGDSALGRPALAGVSWSLLGAWDRPRVRGAADRLMMLSALLLPLSAAATVDVGFTLTLSYLAALAAVVLGAPSVIRGGLRLPRAVVAAAAAVLVLYAVGVVAGSDLGLPSQPDRSRLRDVAYLMDVVLGMAILALLADIVARRRTAARLVGFLCAGATAAALYAIYQWLAQHYGWPAANVNNTLNSDGVTTGARYQGAGVLGWERARGTFKEPLLLASHLVIALPLAGALAQRSAGRARTAWTTATAMIAVALILTSSTLAVGALLVATVASCCVLAVRRGAIRTAAALGATGTVVLFLAPVVFVNPSILSGATGRSKQELRATSVNRIDAWQRATRVWSQRPVAGFGPGQSSIRLAYRPTLESRTNGPLALGSAQGLWAASLIDAGLLGFFAWLAFLATVGWAVFKALLRGRGGLLLACAIAGCAASILGDLSGDRLDIRAWFAIGLAFAAAGLIGKRETTECGESADECTEQRPAGRGGA